MKKKTVKRKSPKKVPKGTRELTSYFNKPAKKKTVKRKKPVRPKIP